MKNYKEGSQIPAIPSQQNLSGWDTEVAERAASFMHCPKANLK